MSSSAAVAFAVMIVAGGIALASEPDSARAPSSEPITPTPAPISSQPARVALGELLFRDRRLSHDDSHSCASCHDIDSNGATRSTCDIAMDGRGQCFNTPTVFNAALNFRFGWEGRFRTLESQALTSLDSPSEMGTSLAEIVAKVNRDPAVIAQFRQAYGREPNEHDVLDAIVAFERSLVTPGSRFDHWLAGESAALSAQELEGYELFKSLGCISCHQGENIGGNLFARQGVFRPLVRSDPAILRVPSLRNVATTAPYFHDGSAVTLDEAVQRMASAQLDSNLTDAQINAIVAWLRTLTGVYRGQHVRAHP